MSIALLPRRVRVERQEGLENQGSPLNVRSHKATPRRQHDADSPGVGRIALHDHLDGMAGVILREAVLQHVANEGFPVEFCRYRCGPRGRHLAQNELIHKWDREAVLPVAPLIDQTAFRKGAAMVKEL